MRSGWLAIGLLVCTTFVAGCAGPPPSWDDYWLEHGVAPPPPRDFLNGGPEPREILNLTNGALSDETVRRWVLADMRRGAGDDWAGRHLRLDVVNAGVLGPRGLNGTDRGIEGELAAGAVEIRCEQPSHVVVAAGVVAVPWNVRQRLRGAHLTEFVIVQAFRRVTSVCERVRADGQTEAIVHSGPVKPGGMSWQLDTGEFREDPVLGDLWYQAHGWSCSMDSDDPLAEICGLVRPR